MREHILLAAARGAFAAATDQDQQRYDEIFNALCANPSLGDPITTLPDELPDTFYRYDYERYHVVYDLPDEATVRIWFVRKGPQ